MSLPPLVIDTNILLDCFVFKDPAAVYLREQIMTVKAHWIATQGMSEEYLRVLTYPNVARRVSLLEQDDLRVLPQLFMQYADVLEAPAKNQIPCVLCRDKDDQIFIDLALAYQGILLSKDHEVLKLHGRKGLTAMNLKQFSSLWGGAGLCS
ncbi:MAG: putative toxin-antitoxin system toxin component, PIN family [Saezia sp.]